VNINTDKSTDSKTNVASSKGRRWLSAILVSAAAVGVVGGFTPSTSVHANTGNTTTRSDVTDSSGRRVDFGPDYGVRW
jgi:hypothetical protein